MRQESDGKGDSLERLLLEIRATLFGCVVAGLLGRRSPFFCGEREGASGRGWNPPILRVSVLLIVRHQRGHVFIHNVARPCRVFIEGRLGIDGAGADKHDMSAHQHHGGRQTRTHAVVAPVIGLTGGKGVDKLVLKKTQIFRCSCVYKNIASLMGCLKEGFFQSEAVMLCLFRYLSEGAEAFFQNSSEQRDLFCFEGSLVLFSMV